MISTSRTRLSVFIASSLDGYIATRDGSLAWLEEAARSDEDYGYQSFLGSVDALAMGRGTYDHIAGLDPLPFGGRPVFVFTHHPPPPRDGVTFWQESPRAALDRWDRMGLGRVYVDGGALISDFLAQGLIDDLVLTKVPVLLGDGLPLFHPIPVGTDLRLDGVQSWPSGFVNLTYSRVRNPKDQDQPPASQAPQT
jgi:dihydrofolate reductase